jgi:Cu/Ag efflux pump CusA
MTAAATMRSVTTLVNGALVGEIYDQQEVHGVVVRGERSLYPDVIALRRLMLDTPTGGQVPLGDIADVSIVPAANTIQRENASRRIDVTCNASGRDLGSVARDVEERVLNEVDFKSGYHPEFLGEFAEAEASRRQILLVSCFALLAILVVLYSDFQSWRLVLLMIVPLPFALLGGVVGAHVAGGVVSLGSLVGFVTVLGIAARNGIMLISHYRHLEAEEGVTDQQELVVRGAEERLAPILMTGLTTGLALVPLIVSGNIPGQEIEYPMALVIVGGLVSASLLNLFVLPAAYRIFGNCRP